MSLRFYYNDLWGGAALTALDEHPNFPAEFTQHRDFSLPCKSLHGSGTDGGTFQIIASNRYLDFDEGGGELTATLVLAWRTADELAADIKAKMEAVGAHTYTVTYVQTGANIYKFSIVDDTGTVALLCNTGTNVANGVWDTIGFSTAADKAAAASHISDSIRIHTHWRITADLGSAQNIRGFFIYGHTLSAAPGVGSVEAKVQWSTDNFSTTASQDDLTQSTKNPQLLYWISDAGKTYRYVRIQIIDVANSDGYVSAGVIWAAPDLVPDSSHQHNSYRETPADLSDLKRSAGGQKSSVQMSRLRSYAMRLRLAAGEKATFDAMIDDRGQSLPLFVVPDSSSPDPKYVSIMGSSIAPLRMSTDTWYLDLELEDEA